MSETSTFQIFINKLLRWSSFASICFLILSTVALGISTRNTLETYGWEYDQTIIIEGREQVIRIRVIDTIFFVIALFGVTLTQMIQFYRFERLIKAKIN